MKYIVCLLLPLLSFCQTSSHKFEVYKDTITLYTEIGDIQFNYRNNNYKSSNSIMDENKMILNGSNQIVQYKRNDIVLFSKAYKFKKPIFSNKTYLIDNSSKDILMEFETNYKQNTFLIKEYSEFADIANKQLKELLKNWVYFKQAQYIHYNYDDVGDAIALGLVAGILAPTD